MDIAVRTLVSSDLVGSTSLIESTGDARAAEIFQRHDRAARDLLRKHGGLEIDKSDGFLQLFERPWMAVRYALDYHQEIHELSRAEGVELAARVGIHLGEVILRQNPEEDVARGAKPLEVEGLAKPAVARLMSLAKGRQTLLTRGTFDVARRSAVDDVSIAEELTWLAHGSYLFKGVAEAIEVFEVGDDRAPLAAPENTATAKRALGGFIEAEPCLIDGYHVLREARGDETVYTRKARRRIVELYEAWGRPEMVEPFREIAQ